MFSAGGIVRKGDLWLIIKCRPSELFPSIRFQLPKGQLEEGESSEEAALREVFEETGVNAKIISKVGYSKFPFEMNGEKYFKIVTYFLMEYESGKLTSNREVEESYWLPFEEARKKLTHSDDKKLLDKAGGLLSTIGPGGSSAARDFESGSSD